MDPTQAVAGSNRSNWILLPVFLVAVVLRLAAMQGDLGLDEVWSWLFVQDAALNHKPAALFTRIDNNHLFNTFVMYAFGPHVAGIWYRMPAAVASIFTVWLAGSCGLRQSGATGRLFAMTLAGGSYLLILYGTEARGYSYALFFAFLSWKLLHRLTESRRVSDAILFAVSSCLGLVSHLTFIYALGGFMIYATAKCLFHLTGKRTADAKRLILLSCTALVPPALMAGVLYFFFIHGMTIGGGQETRLLSEIISTLSVTAGGPLKSDIALVVAAIVAVFAAVGIWRQFASDPASAAFYLTVIFLGPTIVLSITGHTVIYPRYFFLPVGFGLLVIAEVMSEWWRRGGPLRIFAGVLLATYLAANGWWTARLMDHGRGDYSRAIAWIAQESPSPVATVGSDHPFRNGLLFAYYTPRIESAVGKMLYLEPSQVPPQGTDWMILHNFDGDEPYPDTLSVGRNRYQLARVFRHQSLTGYNWWVYRKTPP